MDTFLEWGISFLICIVITAIAVICIFYCIFNMLKFLTLAIIEIDINYIYK